MGCSSCKYCLGHEIHKVKTQFESGDSGQLVASTPVKAQQHWPEAAPPMLGWTAVPCLFAHDQLSPSPLPHRSLQLWGFLWNWNIIWRARQ